MKRFLTIAILFTVAVLGLAACGGAQAPAATQAPAKDVATQVPATSTPAPTATPVPPTPTPTEAAAAAAQLIKPGNLDSFKASIAFSQSLVKPNATVVAAGEMQMLYSGKPAPGAFDLVVSQLEGEAAALGEVRIILAGDVAYISLGSQMGGKWMKTPSGTALAQLGTQVLDPNELAKNVPEDLFSSVNIIDRNETVEGVSTTHYRASEQQIAEMMKQGDADLTIVEGKADFWIANSGNYIKKYAMDVVTEDKDGKQLRQQATLLVMEENVPVEIEIPADADVLDLGSMLPATATP